LHSANALLASAKSKEMGQTVTGESLNRNDSTEACETPLYELPVFSVVSLAVITLGGTPGRDDPGKEGSQNPFGAFQSHDDSYDEDPIGDDPWGSRGGGG